MNADRVSLRLGCAAAFLSAVIGAGPPARAATLQGVTMPDTITLDGAALTLNGIALRTYSFLGIPIYVAGLYVTTPSHDATALLDGTGVKLLRLHFVHNVGQADARHAWQEGFTNNCPAPCAVPADEIARFLAGVPAMHAGEDTALQFDGERVSVIVQGKQMGSANDAAFGRLILATFIGAKPATARLKRELLGGG